jgi:hypothetical protein
MAGAACAQPRQQWRQRLALRHHQGQVADHGREARNLGIGRERRHQQGGEQFEFENHRRGAQFVLLHPARMQFADDADRSAIQADGSNAPDAGPDAPP